MLKFLQRIGKSLMLPIATLPIAGIMLRLGQADVVNALGGIPFMQTILPFFGAAGSALFDNLPLLFALGVAVGFSDDQNGASALAGVISYFTLTNVTKQYWTMNLSSDLVSTLNISFLGGILAGLIGGLCYNKFRKVKLPEFLAFFGGRRLVPIMAGLISVIIAIPLGMIWPTVQGALTQFSMSIVGFGAVGAAIFGLFNRLLIPVGLHHVLNSFFWFQLGSYNGKTGDIARFFAGDPTAGHFMAGFFPIMMFGLPAIALAIYFAAKKEKRKAVGGMLLSLALTSFLTGVTEPIEFLFIFLSPMLLVAHAILTSLSFFIVDSLGILHGFTFSAGAIDYLMNFGLATNPLTLLLVGLGMGVLYFIVFYILIVKLNLPTPGREEDCDEFDQDGAQVNVSGDEAVAKKYVEFLGGSENIVKVENCATRLRLELLDTDKINEKGLKSIGAKGIVKLNKTSAQVIVGTNVEFVADGMKVFLK
ncbi:pts system [[Clostridium] sordellii]|uniref:N-acetylglucosamine-specific PTS transporter subunit IIBC n=1 Tax=Paraclostridium sordellii TaxID=1505 RepID=UPI000542ADE9|nr:N-acetylglucosamine-specific PTS transporter subunit IIBC [Paeniclostridium sordellii]MBS6022828.1 N-acetylglucosamine-specific PTS transporter subunit IIBC [Paeniclostridium sordellii]MCQ4696571.1 N-acetylglucosamine-specific PTS transporter subunit IIBC [Paeniclostridium sordellii]MDU4414325.1 N-acetylglucosamine-specific PTS transporter subunit IIBC [Paeniclostridium sordellii]MDU6481172.1 N-acetylglucosamine-specific PTS transporter subunit IIBC [Paeniclostridium sordellii]MRZ28521.1 PT